MMDCFKVFKYQLAHVEDQEDSSFPPLSSVKVTKININILDAVSYDDPDNVSEFKNLHVDITQQKILFTKMLQQIVKSINDMMVNFVNVTLVCEDIRFFTEIIPRQCERRQLAVPYVFMNFLDLKEIVRNSYECPFRRLSQIVEFLKICPLKEAEIKSQTELMERILRKMHRDKLLSSTSQRFAERCKKLIEETSKEPFLKFKYYKIIGLPFKSFPNEVLNILAPQVPEDRKQMCFIYDRQRFTGRAMIKIPEDYEPYLVAKNRMYIGQRYIELEATVEGQFQKAKIRQENLSVEKSPPRLNRDPRQGRGFFKIGASNRRSRSRSPPQRQRSREKFESFREERPADQNRFEQNIRPTIPTIPPTIPTTQYGIKIRGLPFAFSQWDVENIFTPYNIIGGSVKLGLKPGTTFKNGEAVILMRNYNDAQRSLGMNGFRCMGRYLEVMVIGKDDYLRYK